MEFMMKIRKALLLVPPAHCMKENRDINPLPPMGLGYIASILDRMGIEVKIFDCLMLGWNREQEIDQTFIRVGLSEDRIRQELRDYDPDLVGMTCQFSRQNELYHSVFGLIKESIPQTILVAGGPHVTVCPGEVLSNPHCDYIVLGEGEESIQKLIQTIETGGDFNTLDGIGWKQNGHPIIREKTEWIKDLDSIPSPAYHLMNLANYFGLERSHGIRHKERFMPVVTTRGCPAKCTFCSANQVWSYKYRMRSVDNVIEEMRVLRDRYDIDEIMFEDDNVTANPRRAKELFRRMIDEQFNFTWDTPNGVGVWSIDPEMIDLMKASGCVRINFPVESGSQRILKEIIKKPIKLEKIKQLIDYCRSIHLDYNMFLVIGMPGETIKDIRQSFRFAAECGCYQPHISVATPYPGTELFEKCKKENLFSRPFTFNNLFIRSYMIETDEFNAQTLQKTVKQGKNYLLVRKYLSKPTKFGPLVGKMIRHPFRYLSLIYNLFIKKK